MYDDRPDCGIICPMNTTLCYIKNEKNEYLLIHRTGKENDLNGGKWIGVGGKFEEGETADECVCREVFEETGLTLTRYRLCGLVKFISDTWEDEDMYLYYADGYKGEARSSCDEGELSWVPADKVLTLPTWEGDRYFVGPLLEGRKQIDMVVEYRGDELVRCEDLTEKIETIRSDNLSCPHGFSTRRGGVSSGMFATLNLGLYRGDEKARVAENWRRFLASAGIYKDRIVCGRQVHENTVCIAGRDDAVCIYSDSFKNVCDGYVTATRGLPLAIFSSDCIPLLMEDVRAGIVGAIHCGWRSVVADIIKNAVDAFVSLGSRPEDIHAAIGPAIDKCCFEVGGEVVDAAAALIGDEAGKYYRARGDKFMLDLKGVVKERMKMLDISEKHINILGECTMCRPDRFFSHRGMKGNRGSLASIIMLPEE